MVEVTIMIELESYLPNSEKVGVAQVQPMEDHAVAAIKSN